MSNRNAVDLSLYKAPGSYFAEFDASPTIAIQSNINRLVPGFSRKGIFNRPVFVRSKDEAISIYGDIDPFLEQRGSFFHRSLFTALEAGPVLALALLPVNNGLNVDYPKDEVEFKSFSLNLSEENSKEAKSLYSAFFNKEGFWTLDNENFDAIIKQNFSTNGKLFSIVNLGQKDVSLIIRKATVQGFNVTAQEFYGSSSVPEYLNPEDSLNEFFVEVIALEGNWDDYNKLSVHPLYSKYFDRKGIKKDKLNSFLQDETVKFIGSYVGSVIPDLVDGTGKIWSIDSVVNSSMSMTGLYAVLNREILENYETRLSTDSTLDMVGHQLLRDYIEDGDSVEYIDFLSYFANLKNSSEYSLSSVGAFANTFVDFTDSDLDYEITYVNKKGTNNGFLNNLIKIPKPSSSDQNASDLYTTLKTGMTVDAALRGTAFTSNVATNVYFSITESYETIEYDAGIGSNKTYLNILVSNPALADEETNKYSFQVEDATNKIIFLENHITDDPLMDTDWFPYAYIKPKNSTSTKEPFYVQIITYNYDIDDNKVIVQWDAVDGDTNARLISFLEEEDVSMWEIVMPQYFPEKLVGSNEFISYSTNLNVTQGDSDANIVRAYPGSTLYKDIQRGAIYNGLSVSIEEESDVYYIKVESQSDSSGIPTKVLTMYSSSNLTPSNKTYPFGSGDALFTISHIQDSPFIKNYSIDELSANMKEVTIDYSYANDVIKFKVGDYIAVERELEAEQVVFASPIIAIINNNNGKYTFKTAENIYSTSGSNCILMKNINDYASNYTVSSLSGLKLNEYHYPGNFLNRNIQLEKILGVIAPGTNLYKALTDLETIQFRYIVDTFSGGLSAEAFPKNYLTRLAKDRGRCLAIMNAPSFKEFKESSDPRFTDLPTQEDPKPPVRVDYIKDGGNLSLGPSTRFSLPSEENGSKHSGFFSPYPLVRVNRKAIPVPPAAGISNRFVSKHTDGTKYNPVAGIKYGAFSVTGATGALEYNYTQEERGLLTEIGLNPIVWKPNAGYVIYDNMMAYQRTLSAFNNLSLRDLLITIEDTIDSVLQTYLWDNNTDSLRQEVRTRIETELSVIQTSGGLNTFNVIFDSSNNTGDTISQGFGILDVEIEPTFAIRKFLTRISVTKAGALSQSGFN